MVQSLFDICVSVILGSSYLLERASLHLPQGIAHFLLYLAVESRNQLAVRNLVEKWPYRDLALDFLSNPVCRGHRMASQHCLEPHEYMGVFGSYARYSCHENVSSLLEGIFHNLYRYRTDESGAGLQTVDISAVTVGGQQGEGAFTSQYMTHSICMLFNTRAKRAMIRRSLTQVPKYTRSLFCSYIEECFG